MIRAERRRFSKSGRRRCATTTDSPATLPPAPVVHASAVPLPPPHETPQTLTCTHCREIAPPLLCGWRRHYLSSRCKFCEYTSRSAIDDTLNFRYMIMSLREITNDPNFGGGNVPASVCHRWLHVGRPSEWCKPANRGQPFGMGYRAASDRPCRRLWFYRWRAVGRAVGTN